MTPQLRPCQPADTEFLLRVYSSTREQELATLDWSAEQKDAFTAMQFQAQARHYQEHYPGAEFSVIEVNGEPAGRFYLHRQAEDWRIMDIALLPEFRNRGAGGALLTALLADADAAGAKVSIHVEIFNPARGLYARLGFRQVAERGVYLLLERPPFS
jgi:ribosomal protein S18 acetylase RimI-like enzyme